MEIGADGYFHVGSNTLSVQGANTGYSSANAHNISLGLRRGYFVLPLPPNTEEVALHNEPPKPPLVAHSKTKKRIKLLVAKFNPSFLGFR